MLNRTYGTARYHAANTQDYQEPEKTSTARTYQWAMKFLKDNAGVPFYLLIDHFAPHEPWEAPAAFYRMYADGSYRGKTWLNRSITSVTTVQKSCVSDVTRLTILPEGCSS